MDSFFIPIAILLYLYVVSNIIKSGVMTKKGEFDGIGPVTLEIFFVVIAAVIPLFIVGIALDGLFGLFGKKD